MTDFIYSKTFQGKNAEQRIMHDPPIVPRAKMSWYFRDQSSFYFNFSMVRADGWKTTRRRFSKSKQENLVKKQVLTFEQEQQLFLQYNYARWRHFKASSSEDALKWRNIANLRREMIIEYNLALVWSMITRMKLWGQQRDIEDLIGECNKTLMRAVELFQFTTGNKFSTYACQAIRNTIFRYSSDDGLPKESTDAEHITVDAINTDLLEIREIFKSTNLTDIQRRIIEWRYFADPPMYLHEIGRKLVPPLSKERVRQIEREALELIKERWTNEKEQKQEQEGHESSPGTGEQGSSNSAAGVSQGREAQGPALLGAR